MSETNRVKFKKSWFNPLYFIIRELLRRGVSEFYIYGGKSSSKTISVCQLIAIECLLRKQNALIFRKEGSLIKTTVKPSMQLAIDNCRLSNGYKKMDFSFRTMYNNYIVFKGLDHDEKAKGIEGFSWVLFDELNHFSYEEYEQLILSFRGEQARAFFGTWNPVSENSWVKKDLIDKDEWHDTDLTLPSKHSFVQINKLGNRALIKTIYEDNFWTVSSPCKTFGYRDEKTLQKYERLRQFDDEQYQINVLGNWGVIKAGHPYFLHLSKPTNGADKGINEEHGIILSFDFNVKNSVSFWQKYRNEDDEWVINCFRELRMGGSADTDLEAICEIIANDYKEYEISFTGDSSGNNKSALTKGNAEAFKLVYGYLTKNGCRFLTYNKIISNPRRKKSRFVSNAITKAMGSRFSINTECVQLWTDVIASPIDETGELDKKYCEKNGLMHLGDTLRYFIWVYCFDIWQEIKADLAIPREFEVDSNNVEKDAYN